MIEPPNREEVPGATVGIGGALYRRQPDTTLSRDSRGVIDYPTLGPDGVSVPSAIFRCPCGYRTVKVSQPPHTIIYDDDGLLTLEGSVGSRKTDEHPQNWCHFHVKEGRATMCGDAKCPGESA